jgi:hypothetical protein
MTNDAVQTLLYSISLVGIGMVLGFAICMEAHNPASATECCAQFDVPFNTQLEMETAQFEREVWGRTYQPLSSPYNDPCRR